MKKLFFLSVLFFACKPVFGQYIKLSGYGYSTNRFSVDSVFFVPNSDTSFSGNYHRAGALVFRTISGDRSLYLYNGIFWQKITAISTGISGILIAGDSILIISSNSDTVGARFPLYNPTSSDSSIQFTGNGKVFGDSLNIAVDTSKIPHGLLAKDAVYGIVADTGISVSGGDSTQFFKNVNIKANYDSPIWNAAKLQDVEVELSPSEDTGVLVYQGGSIYNLPTSFITAKPKINGGTDISIAGGNIINDTSNLQSVSNRGATTSNNIISGSGFTVKKNILSTTVPYYFFQNSSAKQRWSFGLSGVESGNNAGGDFSITGYDDSGASLGSYITVNRYNGWVGIGKMPNSLLDVNGKIAANGLRLDLTGSTEGDIYYVGSGGDFERLPIGAPGNVLTVEDGLPKWSPFDESSLLDSINNKRDISDSYSKIETKNIISDSIAANKIDTSVLQPKGSYLTTESDPVFIADSSALLKKITAASLYQLVGNYLTGNQNITLSGDASGSGTTSIPVTLKTVNANAGTFGNSTNAGTFTVNAKGLITAASTTAIAFPVTSVNGSTGAVSLGLSNLNDATITTPSNGQLLKYNGTKWINFTPSYLTTETEPAFNASIAHGITGSDTARWNSGLSSYTETDPIANAKTITNTQGSGILITGTAGQTLSTNPSWIFKADTSLLATKYQLNIRTDTTSGTGTSVTQNQLSQAKRELQIFAPLTGDTSEAGVVKIKTDTGTLATQYWVTTHSSSNSGTVTNVSSGNLSPLFNTSVSNAATTPAISYTLSNAAPHKWLGNNTSATGAPAYVSIDTSDISNFYQKVRSLFSAGTNVTISNGVISAVGGGGAADSSVFSTIVGLNDTISNKSLKLFTDVTMLGSLSNDSLTFGADTTKMSTKYYVDQQIAATGAATVSSVGLSLPSIFTVSGSPVTSTGTLTGTLASQTANKVFAAPDATTGTPTFRFLTTADLPSIPESQVTNLTSDLSGKLPASIGSPATGQLLKYNGTTWVNFTPSYLNTETDPLSVHLTGSQTVAGDKTFSDDIILNGQLYIATEPNAGDTTMKMLARYGSSGQLRVIPQYNFLRSIDTSNNVATHSYVATQINSAVNDNGMLRFSRTGILLNSITNIPIFSTNTGTSRFIIDEMDIECTSSGTAPVFNITWNDAGAMYYLQGYNTAPIGTNLYNVINTRNTNLHSIPPGTTVSVVSTATGTAIYTITIIGHYNPQNE